MKSLFVPKSIAVVGASNDSRKIGHHVLNNLIQSKFEGKLYPVNAKGGEILGIPVVHLPDRDTGQGGAGGGLRT